MANIGEIKETTFSSISCNTKQSLSNNEHFQINMSVQPNVEISDPTIFNNKQIEKYFLKINLNSSLSKLSIPDPKLVILDMKKDGDGYVATSQKYYKFVGIGNTKSDAANSFRRLFEHPKYGEQLSNSHIEYIW